MNKNFLLTLCVSVFGIAVMLFSWYTIREYTARQKRTENARRYERAWNISIPSDFAEERHLSSDHGFRGDGWRYTRYWAGEGSFSAFDASILPNEELGVWRDNSENKTDPSLEDLIERILVGVEVPEKDRSPDTDCLWIKLMKSDDYLVILYYPDIAKVFF